MVQTPLDEVTPSKPIGINKSRLKVFWKSFGLLTVLSVFFWLGSQSALWLNLRSDSAEAPVIELPSLASIQPAVTPLVTASPTATHSVTPNPSPTTNGPVASSPTWWRPPPGLSFQWQLTGELDLAVDADVYDVDLFTTTAEQIAQLKAQGRRVICYVNVGAWEEYRDDRDQFPHETLGAVYAGYPDERWLDIRQIELLAPILRARFDLCQDKGFDGLEPDNINGFENETGFPLTAADQLAFNLWLAVEAHARGLSIGLKNDGTQAAELVNDFDWALVEGCVVEGFCEEFLPFIKAKKAVFITDYTDTRVTFDQVCEAAKRFNFTGILKDRDLPAAGQFCPTTQ